jgi:large subunit ribosomal protein L24
MRIRKNDQVRVMAGKDKGKEGRILSVLPAKGRVLVEQVNMVKKHTRAIPQRQIRGGIVEKEAPIHRSNVALVCSECGPTRIQFRAKAGGKKVRVCAKCETVLDL